MSEATTGGPPARTALSPEFQVQITDGHDGELPPLAAQWEACLAKAPAHQQIYGFEWFASWMKHLGTHEGWTGENRVLMAVSPTGEAHGILPLARLRKRGLSFWALAGYFQPVRGFVCRPEHQEAVCEALAGALLRQQRWNEFLRLGPYNTAYPERASLLAALQRQCSRVVVFKGGATIVARNVPESPEAYQQMVQGSSSMKRIRSYERRMEREGETLIRHFHDVNAEDARQMLADVSYNEQRSWVAGAGGFPRFTPGRSLAFWEQVCARQLAPRGQLDVWLAYFNKEPVAFRFTLTVGPTRYLIANQYDEKYAQYRLGWVLYLRDMEDCARRGVRALDMGSGDLHYKSRWGGVEEAIDLNVLVLPPGPAGWLGARVLAIDAVHQRAKRVLGG